MSTPAPLVLHDKSTLCALDPASGRPLWSVEIPECKAGMSRLVVQDGVVVVAGYDTLCCVALADGRVYWKVKTRRAPRYGVLVRDGRVFLYQDGAIDCYDGHGQLVWSREAESHHGGSFGFPGDVCWVPDPR